MPTHPNNFTDVCVCARAGTHLLHAVVCVSIKGTPLNLSLSLPHAPPSSLPDRMWDDTDTDGSDQDSRERKDKLRRGAEMERMMLDGMKNESSVVSRTILQLGPSIQSKHMTPQGAREFEKDVECMRQIAGVLDHELNFSQMVTMGQTVWFMLLPMPEVPRGDFTRIIQQMTHVSRRKVVRWETPDHDTTFNVQFAKTRRSWPDRIDWMVIASMVVCVIVFGILLVREDEFHESIPKE